MPVLFRQLVLLIFTGCLELSIGGCEPAVAVPVDGQGASISLSDDEVLAIMRGHMTSLGDNGESVRGCQLNFEEYLTLCANFNAHLAGTLTDKMNELSSIFFEPIRLSRFVQVGAPQMRVSSQERDTLVAEFNFRFPDIHDESMRLSSSDWEQRVLFVFSRDASCKDLGAAEVDRLLTKRLPVLRGVLAAREALVGELRDRVRGCPEQTYPCLSAKE